MAADAACVAARPVCRPSCNPGLEAAGGGPGGWLVVLLQGSAAAAGGCQWRSRLPLLLLRLPASIRSLLQLRHAAQQQLLAALRAAIQLVVVLDRRRGAPVEPRAGRRKLSRLDMPVLRLLLLLHGC